MHKKIFFFDIDGTLVNEHKMIPESTIKAIHQLQQLGHITVIASGRAPFMLEHISKILNINSFVSFNGSLVIHEGDIVFKNLLDKVACQEIIDRALTLGHELCWQSSHNMAVSTNNPIVNETMEHMKVGFPIIDPQFFLHEDIYQGLLFVDEQAQQQYPVYDAIRYLRWHPNCIDLIPANGSKAEGIKQLVKVLGFDIADTVAFGDERNDMEMIQTVGLGIAMGNAIDELKAIADDVTLSVNNDGIEHALIKYGFIS